MLSEKRKSRAALGREAILGGKWGPFHERVLFEWERYSHEMVLF